MREAGRELDAMVAQGIFACYVDSAVMTMRTWEDASCCEGVDVPNYSTNISDAMLVVDELTQRVNYMGTYRDGFRMEWDGEQWEVGFIESTDADCMASHFEYDCDDKGQDITYGPCRHKSLPMAICLYALKVSGIPVPSLGAPRASNQRSDTGNSGA